LKNNELAKQLELDRGEVISQWYLVVNLENLADYIKNISEISKTKKDKRIKDVVLSLQQNYLDVMKARHNDDKILADSVIKRRKEIFILCKKLENQEISSIIRAITTTINNIAKIIIDKE
jgi:ribosomal protein L36